MNNHKHGFTIVELLSVIVVIAILAAISIVSFTGIQQRATNTKTISAVQSWAKALNFYRVDEGRMPGGWVCLGTGYSYGESGNDSSGAQCRKDASSNFTTSPSFDATMEPYLGGSPPTPGMVTTSRPDGTWRRGLMYAYNGGAGNLTYISASYKGNINCPDISGVERVEKSDWQGDTVCIHVIEER